ncbi:MAG: hypothetical protein GX945_00130 [Lentisphaerae bacterium]|nr:hypothetical protein [Lentisphaerota bacterium]
MSANNPNARLLAVLRACSMQRDMTPPAAPVTEQPKRLFLGCAAGLPPAA